MHIQSLEIVLNFCLGVFVCHSYNTLRVLQGLELSEEYQLPTVDLFANFLRVIA